VEDVRDRPRFREADAARLAAECYGLAVTARPLPSERDQNFLLEGPSGERHVLKFAHPAVRREILEAQNQAMDHLTRRGFPCPGVCRTPAGEHILPVVSSGQKPSLMRLLTYLPGRPLAHVRPHTPELLRGLGRLLGDLSRGLSDFDHPAAHRELVWDLAHFPRTLLRYSRMIADPERRRIVETFLAHYEEAVPPLAARLRTGVIHNDANDFNLLVAGTGDEAHACGLIDFGDMVHSARVHELAVALAYAMLGKEDPLAAAAEVAGGYHERFPLEEAEVDVLYLLACARLCLSVSLSAHQRRLEPANEYLSISEAPAWELLDRLAGRPGVSPGVHPRLARAILRHACGLSASPGTPAVVAWLREHREAIGKVVEPDLNPDNVTVLDLGVGSTDCPQGDALGYFPSPLRGEKQWGHPEGVEESSPGQRPGKAPPGADVEAWSEAVFRRIREAGAEVGVGRYDEARVCYTAPQFLSRENGREGWRTIHLGIDLFLPAGSPVRAPLDGTIHSFRDNDRPLDYGPTVILRHEAGDGVSFFTLYGHLSGASLDGLAEGQVVLAGELIGEVGDVGENGGWPPHLHLQLIIDLLDCVGDFPGVAEPDRRAVWRELCPDPNLILHIPEKVFPPRALDGAEILAHRAECLGRSLSVSYRAPVHIVRASGAYLFDVEGRVYLDAVNNVAHVGHGHPRVVAALARQAAVLNTNTRYLHENIVRYARRLCATLPEPLRVCFFVNSGSEANDLAWRLARAYTGRSEAVVVDGAYHGHLSSLIDLSPYKFDGPGGAGAPAHVHKVPMPDGYRGPYKHADPEAGVKYASHVGEALARSRGVAAFFCESLLSCGGQVVLPPGYLAEAYRRVRAAGGVCIADEVQVGFGRVGTHFWGFETQGVVPDIVTLGKSIGNGHPLGAVVTTPAIAEAFAGGMEYFNTYGGNPVSCAVGLAVLDVIAEERLQERALAVGTRLKEGLNTLVEKHALIGEVRGMGLFLGIELVEDRDTLAPAAAVASYAMEGMRQRRVLLSTDGPLHNVLKIKPPLTFSAGDADRLVQDLDRVLSWA
jgi:4-aminobutyrate aminotransferase-like enzyme/Ser/Thr protein kinase RdoA (MazF antagonist)/murein DD-endopeptidase MepM/ murein hydrolase activator NlpD